MKEPSNIAAVPSIAVVGMAGRFPGARNLTEFWRNLRDGVESISLLRDDQLIAAGATAAEIENPDYVKAAAILDDIDRFDAAFFGLSPRDAAIMDPQHRHFLECAWEALENAGWSADEFGGRVGVYAGSGMNTYLIHNLLANAELVANAGLFLLKQTGNDKDVLASRVSYQLNLTGPSLAVQTACSTSLVAIHLACQSLLNHECDMALAGGVTIEIPHGLGYLYREGEILSRDGHCRSFDAASSGTVFGSGLGIVVLRRLEDAVRDGDFIHAVIRGTAINNDGARKVSYLAPSVAGQADAIVEALAVADADADSISYVETHGTGTTVGDPIEIAALTRAFRVTTERNGFCAIGSLKTNIGHLDTAAGVAGFIKTVLALEHHQIPPSLNFSEPNPLIDFDHSPFFVNSKLRDWESDDQPRRAGVTSLGIGGTNAHAILEEAPMAMPSGPSRRWQVLTLSAKTPTALDAMARNLAEHLEERSPNLPDVAFTSHLGRKAFRFRRAIICKDSIDAAGAIRQGSSRRVFSNSARENERPLIFLCPGQGSQYLSMGRGLYESEPVFKSTIDFCADYLRELIGVDLRTVLFPSEASSAAAELLNQTRLTQPALFVLEYAVAKLWSSWGIVPSSMIGHSVGEFAAACIAGVFSLEAGLQIIAERGRLIQSMPAGSMTAVALPESEVLPLLNGKLSLASVNADEQCVVSGPDFAIGDLEKLLADKQLGHHRLRVSHAFHSSMMDPILPEFADFVRRFELAPPRIPYISSATGTWITDAEAIDPGYWARQLRQTVRFSNGIEQALKTPDAILLEVGPGNTLSALCEQNPTFSASHEVVSSLRTRGDDSSDEEFILGALGQLWAAGQKIDWNGFHADERRRRLPLPTYPFERERFWIEPDRKTESVAAASTESAKEVREIGFFSPVWKRADLAERKRGQDAGPWLIFEDSQGLGIQIAQLLRHSGEQSIAVKPGRRFARIAPDKFEIDPDDPADYQRLLTEIVAQGKFPRTIAHLWSVCGSSPEQNSPVDLAATETMSFYSLMFLGQALGAIDVESRVQIAAISDSLHRVADEPTLNPVRALIAGPCGVIPKELPNVSCRNIDVEIANLSSSSDDNVKEAARQVVAELQSDQIESPVAYRKNRRWVQTFSRSLDLKNQPAIALRNTGVYLITGGLGGIGLALAESIARTVRSRLVLVGRSAFPSRESWDEWLNTHSDHDATARQIRKIRAIENAGAEVIVATGDACDPKAMQRIADQVRTRLGPISGIIHAAGVLDDAPMLQRDRTSAARVLAPKVRGTLVLESVFQRDSIDFFVVMSSVSSHLAPAGQLDYTAANAFLDAFARSRSHQGQRTRFVSIQWPRWTDVGMAAVEVDSYPGAIHPLLGHARHQGQGRTTYSTTLSLEDNWIVSEHRLTAGAGLFPATGYLEMVRAAVVDMTGSSALSVSDFFIGQPLRVKPESAQTVQLLLRKQGEAYRFSARTYSELSHQWLECASGGVTVASKPSQSSHYDIDELRKRCNSSELGLDHPPRIDAQERHIEFGPRWRNLKTVWLGRNEALSLLDLPVEFASEVDTYRLHPALLDMATGSAMFLIQGNETTGYLYVPISYGTVSIFKPLSSTCYAYVRNKNGLSIESSIATFDVSILDLEGNAIVEIRDFSVRQIRDVSLLESEHTVVTPGTERTVEFEAIEEDETAKLADAISSEEGVRAFNHVLRNPRGSNVIIFPSDFSAYIDRGKPRPTAAESEKIVEIPSGDANEELEATLTLWWKELLGVDSVAIRDNFFDLGGQSLTGVRLVTKIRKKYGVDLKLATLFSAPTIEKLCSLIRDQTAAPASHSLIEIQPKGAKPPLFIIHEIEGSVLVFRDLIKHLEPDQPIWGVEYSLGESSAPYLRMEDLAAHYLAQVRKLQPNGPYYFLGYSFGGLLAFEIAQQLRAAGEPVALVGMLDTFLMNGVRASSQQRSLIERVKGKAASLGRHAGRLIFGPQRRAYLKEDLAERLDAIIGQGRQFIYGVLRAGGFSIPKFLHRAKDVNWFAALRYVALPYNGCITLFRATIPLRFIDMPTDRELGWGPLAEGGVEVHEIPGTHREIMREPNVSILAHEVSKCLAAARKQQGSDSNSVLSEETTVRGDSTPNTNGLDNEILTRRNEPQYARSV